MDMKKFFLLLILVSTSISSQAKFFDFVKKIGGGILYGVADKVIEKSGDQQTIENWNTIKENIKPSETYSSDAGNKLASGDYVGAAVSATSATAVQAGVDEKIVALGNQGFNHIINGDNNAAMIDVTQMYASAAGVKGIDQVCDAQRNINKINQEYRENIRNGMSKEEATQIRNSKIGSEIGSLWVNMEDAHNEAKREKAMKKREILQEAIMQRGYNQMEANYYSRCIDPTEVDANNPSSVDIVLDLYHIAYKEPSSKDSFFDEGSDIPKPVLEDKPTIVEEVPAPKPVVDERANAVKAISETVLSSYALNNVELSDVQKKDLNQVADKLNKYDDIQIIIIGHTCNIGTQKVNQNIGERRAKTAKNYLMSKGVSENRIQIESRDFSEPVAENDTEDHRKQNRRVTFIVKQSN